MVPPLPAQVLDHIFHQYDSRFRYKETHDETKPQFVLASRFRLFDMRRIRIAEWVSRVRIRQLPEHGVTTFAVAVPSRRKPSVSPIAVSNRLRSNAKRKFEMSNVVEMFVQRDHSRKKELCMFSARYFEVFDSCGEEYRRCLGQPDIREYDVQQDCNVHRVFLGIDQARLTRKMRLIRRL